MRNKLVVIIYSLKVPKIKKILLYEMKFLVPNYSCLQNPWLGGYSPQIPLLSVLCPQLNLLNLPRKKIPGYATALHEDKYTYLILSRLILQRMRNVSDKSCWENQNTHFIFNIFFFLISCRLWDDGRILQSRTGHKWQHGARALHVGNLRLQTNTQNLQDKKISDKLF